MATSTLNLVTPDGIDFLSQTGYKNPGSLRSKLRKFARVIQAVAGGKKGAVTYGLVAASCTATLVTAVATNVLTINGAAVTAAQLHARATATFSSLANNDTVTLQGVVFTAKTSPAAGSFTEFALGANDTAAAANLVVLVNKHYSLLLLVKATSAAGVVTFRAVDYGTAGNAITLVSSNGTRAAVTGSGFLAGGAAPTGDQWDYGDTDTQGAASLSAAINRSTTALIAKHVQATSALGVVTVTAKQKGQSGNAITAAKTGAPITLAGAGSGRMTGGTETTVSL